MGKDLLEGKGKVLEIIKKYKDVGVKDKTLVWNTDLIETLELENLLTQAAQLIVSRRLVTNLVELRLMRTTRIVMTSTS